MTSLTSTSAVGRTLSSPFLLLGILLIAANLRAPITSLGPVLAQLQEYFALTPAAAGFLNAMPLIIFACASPLAPRLTRTIGLERALFVALCLIGSGCIVRSAGLSGCLWTGTLMLSLGIAIANVLIVPLVKKEFPHQAALCIGLYAATMALMAALASGVSAPLSAITDLGWRLSLGVWFLIAVVALLCWWPQLKTIEALPTPVSSATQAGSIWKSPVAWQVSMFMALQTTVFYTLIDWFPSMAQSAGIGAVEAGGYLFVYQAIAVVANLATSAAIKRFADQRVLGFCCSIAIVIGVSGLLCAPAHALTWLLFAGVGAGMSMVTCLSLLGLRARDHLQASSLSAMAQCVGYGLGATSPFLCGWLHDLSASWVFPLALLLAAACAQTVFAVLAGRNRYVF